MLNIPNIRIICEYFMKRILNTETVKYLGKKVKVCGWVHSISSHRKIIFIDLRDSSGLLQIVITPKIQSLYKIAQKIEARMGHWD